MFVSCIMLNYYNCENRHSNEKIEEIRIDTVYINDTIRVIQPIHDTIYLNKYITDTLTLAGDTVKVPVIVPISTKIYSGEQYRAVISGFKAVLDTIDVYPEETIIYRDRVVYTPKKNGFLDKFNYGVQLGVGYGFFNRKPDLYLGFGINYNF